jgi:hypothetical protein
VGVDVRSQPQVPARASGQEPGGEVERDPVDVIAQQEPEADVAPGHQRERGEEVLAELAVGDPRRAWLGFLERERVDEDRPAAAELDVVGGRVAEGEAALSGRDLRVECRQRRVLEHSERPLVGVGDRRDRLRSDDCVGEVGVGGGLDGRRLVGDEETPRLELAEQAGCDEVVPTVGEGLVDLAVQDAVAAVDEARRVAERAGVANGAGQHGRRVSHRRRPRTRSGGAVGRVAGLLGRRRRVRVADRPDEPSDLLAEEERHRDDRRDDGLDDQAAGSRIDVQQ